MEWISTFSRHVTRIFRAVMPALHAILYFTIPISYTRGLRRI
jgi:hypothetical protein